MPTAPAKPFIAIACGGTGGHLFPGIAVGEELILRGCDVTLMVSGKDVDQAAVKSISHMGIVKLPAVGLMGWNVFRFGLSFWQSRGQSRQLFDQRRPVAVLGMGGFTSAPPLVAARAMGIATFIHESNTIPGRANRWLAGRVNGAFVYFPETRERIQKAPVTVTGMPVRPGIQPLDAGACRRSLGLDPARPTLLVMGGSQGARGVNDLVLGALSNLTTMAPQLQYLHLTGATDHQRLQAGYASHRAKAVVHPFLNEMNLALGAATAVISRAGASSLAELAALRLPSVLVPYPFAADNHQLHNARAFVESGAARMLEQGGAKPEELVWLILELIGNRVTREAMGNALARWHNPAAAAEVAGAVLFGAGLKDLGKQRDVGSRQTSVSGKEGPARNP